MQEPDVVWGRAAAVAVGIVALRAGSSVRLIFGCHKELTYRTIRTKLVNYLHLVEGVLHGCGGLKSHG